MDFRDFRRAVEHSARSAGDAADRIAPAAERVAPLFKAGTLMVLPFATAGAAAPLLPFVAVLPSQLFLPIEVQVPLFLFSQTFREGIAGSAATETGPQAVSLLVSQFLTPAAPHP